MKLLFSHQSKSKPAKYRRFNYQPRHYDEVKYDIEVRRQRILLKLNSDSKYPDPNVVLSKNQEEKRAKIRKRFIIWIIAVLFFTMLYLVFNELSLIRAKSISSAFLNVAVLLILGFAFIRISNSNFE